MDFSFQKRSKKGYASIDVNEPKLEKAKMQSWDDIDGIDNDSDNMSEDDRLGQK